MFTQRAWGDDLVTPEHNDGQLGLESLATIAQGPVESRRPPHFKPVNIVVENGLHYATIYVCEMMPGTKAAQQVSIWLSSLKETDHIHLTLQSLLLDIPTQALLDLLGAFASTKAKVEIHLDQIVVDGLAYFYLLADRIIKGSAGALFIPSYVDQRQEDKSAPWKATHDFYAWIIEEAVGKGRLTEDEATRLNRGSHVIIPDDRFAESE